MGNKKKFRPLITRIKLNPEQAVLTCCQQTVRTAVRAAQNCAHPQQCPSLAPDASSS